MQDHRPESIRSSQSRSAMSSRGARRRSAVFGLGALAIGFSAALFGIPSAQAADAYPTKPIRLIVPFA